MNKNKKSSPADFIRYHADKMRSDERNAFERKLQKDPFAKEAAEGFATVTPDEAREDIGALKKQLEKRTNSKRKLVYNRIAALIAALIAVSSILIIVERSGSHKQIASNFNPETTLLIPESRPLSVPEGEKPQAAPMSKNPDKKSERSVNKDIKTEPAKVEAPAEKTKTEEIRTPDSKASAAAMPEVAREKKSEAEAVGAAYLPPQPVTGKSNFDKYIRENLRWPDTTLSSTSAVVVLSFKVNTNGAVDTIEVIKSPGKLFSEEAIRLIRSGPAWKPAEENGKPVEEEARVRIVFR